MRKLVLGLVGAAAMTLATAANATLVLTTPTSVSVSGPSSTDGVNYTFGYSDSGTNSPFTETVSWVNDLSGWYGVTLSTVATRANGPTDVDITAAFLTGPLFVALVVRRAVASSSAMSSSRNAARSKTAF